MKQLDIEHLSDFADFSDPFISEDLEQSIAFCFNDIIENCYECPYVYFDNFLTLHCYHKNAKDHDWMLSKNSIPEWCPLENSELEVK